MRRSFAWLLPLAFLTAGLSLSACKGCSSSNTSADTNPAASNKAVQIPSAMRSLIKAKPKPTSSTLPIPAESIDAVVNPGKLPAYTGPTGTVEGTVHISGDKAPEVPLRLPTECAAAQSFYDHLFREGPGRTVADALVAVTGYKGYVPMKNPEVQVAMMGCAFDKRTIAMTFGQYLEVRNTDTSVSYIPFLLGDPAPAHMVAMPKGDPIKLYPQTSRRYELQDEMKRPWMKADIYVLGYPTHQVTGLDGRFHIEGIPVGEVKVSTLLPAIDATAERTVKVEEGKTVQVDLQLTYKQGAAPKASASAAPQPTVH